jgi:MOSC domain-containing protein YiiM
LGNEEEVKLEVTKIGKECPRPCRIYYLMGSCIMPEEGIFCKVVKPGKIKAGDKINYESYK